MKKKILVVEDDSTQSKLIEKILKGINCEAIVANNGRKALELAEDKSNKIGVILLDLSLPDISGLEVLAELKKKKIKTPTAILSINEDVSTAVECIKAGADDFFVKYKNKEELERLFNYINENLSIKI